MPMNYSHLAITSYPPHRRNTIYLLYRSSR